MSEHKIKIEGRTFSDYERALQRVQLLAKRIQYMAPILMESLEENSDAAMMDSCEDGAREIVQICEAMLDKHVKAAPKFALAK